MDIVMYLQFSTGNYTVYSREKRPLACFQRSLTYLTFFLLYSPVYYGCLADHH